MEFVARRCAQPGVVAVDASTDRSFARHCHDQFGIGLIRDGAHVSWSGRGLVEAGPGWIISVNPGEVHDGRPLGGRARSWSMLYFDPSAIEAAFADLTEGARAGLEFGRPALSSPRARAAFLRLYGGLTALADPRDADPEADLLVIAATLLDRAPRDRLPDGRLRIVADAVTGDPSRPWRVAELARLAGITKFQMIRLFKAQLGLTPHRFVQQARLALARRAIAAGSPLAEAAAFAGFADQSHMTRLFRGIYGYTPGGLAATRG